LTVMLLRPNSTAKLYVKPITACFDAV
jgi:hypothetical protein